MASTTVVPNAIIPEFLNVKNYEQWSLRVKTYLLAEDLWEAVKPTTETPQPEPEDGEECKAWTRKNAKALHVIQNSCGSDMFSVITKIFTAKDAWEALENHCKAKQKAENDRKEFERYVPFNSHVIAGDWENAKKCLTKLPDAIRAIDPRDGDGDTALHVAARAGNMHIVKELVLLMSQEDLQIKNVNGSTALHSAVKAGEVDILKELAVPLIGEVKDYNGDTVLHIAVKRSDARIVKELMKLMRREDLEIKNNDGSTALYLAVMMEDVPIVKELLPYDDFDRYIPFTNSIIEGDWENAKECFRELDPYDAVRARDPRDGCGNTALHVAARHGHVEIVKELVFLMTQEVLEVKNADAAVTENLNVDLSEGAVMERAKCMVEKNEKKLSRVLEQKNAFGNTALQEAVSKGHVDIVKELVPSMRPEGFEVKNDEGSTALLEAVSKGNVDIVKELVLLMRSRPKGFEVKNNAGYTALHEAVRNGNIDIVKELVPLMRQEGFVIKDPRGSIALHRAVEEEHVHIVKELVSFMRPEDLEIKDDASYTALGRAMKKGRRDRDVKEIAKYMAGKNKKVFGIDMPDLDFPPVVWACMWSKMELGRYLYSLTPPEALNGYNGSYLITVCIKRMKNLDIAWHLLQLYPRLAVVGGSNCPMITLARMHYAFLSTTPLTFWQKWIYHSIHIQPIPDINVDDISINVPDQGIERDLTLSVTSLLRRRVNDLLKSLGITSIYEKKLIHARITKFLHCMGKVTRNDNLTTAEDDIVTKSFFKAIENGHVEFVIQMCKANPKLISISDKEDRDIFQFAVECRQENIYNLIYGLEEERKNKIVRYVTKDNCNILHSAGNLSPLPRLNHIQGASLQMQRELQWFSEVKSIAPFDTHESLNYSNSWTARELFTTNHKELMEEAKKSIKGTASSCTVVGSLIATMMFAAAFTFPGGNNSNTGVPMFIDKKLFLAFIVSDTLSLVSSTTSVIIFLGLLTSRYAEDDFLKSLPRKMMIGLFMLFISIATMMIAFSCALIMMLHGKYSWTVVPSILLGSVPIVSFVWVQFPLLVGTFMSTYGQGIFDKKIQPWY